MPANLPPQYFEAEKAYRQAKSIAEKIEALETMLAIMPKHKGTDHLRGELRERIAKLAQEAERQARSSGRAQLYEVPREGAGQVAVVGLPNAGKSRLVAELTGAPVRFAEFPFTTQLPQPAMMPFENVQVQLVDLPPFVDGATPGWLRALARHADLDLLVVNLGDDPLAEWELLRAELGDARVRPIAPGAEPDVDEESVAVPKPSMLVGTRLDQPGAGENLELLRLEVGNALPVVGWSAETGDERESLRERIFRALDVARVYTKPPGKPVDRARPFVLKRGSTIADLADLVHRDLREHLKYAVLWGSSGKFAGQRVGPRHVLEDEDVVELYE